MRGDKGYPKEEKTSQISSKIEAIFRIIYHNSQNESLWHEKKAHWNIVFQ